MSLFFQWRRARLMLAASLFCAANALAADYFKHRCGLERLTASYDLLTNVATGLVFHQMTTWLLAGIPFALWHIGYNIALFAALGTPLTAVFARYGERLSA